MAEHSFQLKGTWNGGRNGEGTIDIGALQSAVSAPSALDGPGVGTNPEEMIIGASSTCYMITLAAVLDNRKLPVASLTLNTEGVVSDEGGLHVVKIIHRPQIVLQAGATPEQVEVAQKGAVRAEQACMISKAMRGNVEFHVEASVTVQG